MIEEKVWPIKVVKEFQRLKAKEQELIGWSAKRELAKIDYHPIER